MIGSPGSGVQLCEHMLFQVSQSGHVSVLRVTEGVEVAVDQRIAQPAEQDNRRIEIEVAAGHAEASEDADRERAFPFAAFGPVEDYDLPVESRKPMLLDVRLPVRRV